MRSKLSRAFCGIACAAIVFCSGFASHPAVMLGWVKGTITH